MFFLNPQASGLHVWYATETDPSSERDCMHNCCQRNVRSLRTEGTGGDSRCACVIFVLLLVTTKAMSPCVLQSELTSAPFNHTIAPEEDFLVVGQPAQTLSDALYKCSVPLRGRSSSAVSRVLLRYFTNFLAAT